MGTESRMVGNKMSYQERDSVAYLGFGYNNEKSMTVLDRSTLEELDKQIETIENNQKNLKGVIFFTHKEKCFLAGADINLIAGFKTEAEAAESSEKGQLIFNRIEDLKIPTVACVHGVCLGGGLELALTCKYLLISDDPSTQLGLPEVKLGILPGLGGTYRLPLKIGLPNALDLILTGKSVHGKKCVRLGLADEIYPKERLQEMAVKKHFQKKKKTAVDLVEKSLIGRKLIFQKARETVLKKTQGRYEAPLKILDTMELAAGKNRQTRQGIESQAFGELCMGDQSKKLRHIFFITESGKKYSGPSSSCREIKRGAVLGAGTMGGGIAWLMAKQNMAPFLKDIRFKALERGLQLASSYFSASVARKRMGKEDFQRKMRSMTPTIDYRGFGSMDLVVEAVIEDDTLKKGILAEVEPQLSEDCFLVSNTSSYSIEYLAGVLKHPERFAGLHFFNPVNRMPLVEIITHSKIDPQTLHSLYQWCLKAKKVPLIIKDGPGFLVNRLLVPYLSTSVFLLEEGVALGEIEQAGLDFGMPMGPFRLMDEVGLDVIDKAIKVLQKSLGERIYLSKIIPKLLESNALGQKNGKGFYLYDRKIGQRVNPTHLPPVTNKMDREQIQKHLFYPMVNEACRILEEGLLEKAENIDLGAVYGMGFPPFRGGPFPYADREGIQKIVKTLDMLMEEKGSGQYAVCDYLKSMATQNKTFYR